MPLAVACWSTAILIDIILVYVVGNQEGTERSTQAERIILELNKSGMEYLAHSTRVNDADQHRESLELLKKAEKLVNEERRVTPENTQLHKLLGITLNNLGCYYKK